MRAPGPRLRALGCIASAALTLAACQADDADEQATTEDPEPDEGGESETGDEPPPGDACVDTPLVIDAPTRLQATLRNANPGELGEHCGLDGPTVFIRLRVPGRVDLSFGARGFAFTPRVRAQLPGCVSLDEDPDRLLACAEQLPVTLFDLGPDVELLLAVGIGADDPALELAPAEPGGPEEPLRLDPLDFELDIELRAVLAAGQLCGPALGRCEAGSVCLEPEPADPPDPEQDLRARCVQPPADSCAAPGELELPPPGASVELAIPAAEPHSDAHEHACAGWRRPERVERLTLPAGLEPGAGLRVVADDPGVGLALRGSSCAPEDALACAAPGQMGSQTVLEWGAGGALSEAAEAGETPVLFIELPATPADLNLTLEIVSG